MANSTSSPSGSKSNTSEAMRLLLIAASAVILTGVSCTTMSTREVQFERHQIGVRVLSKVVDLIVVDYPCTGIANADAGDTVWPDIKDNRR